MKEIALDYPEVMKLNKNDFNVEDKPMPPGDVLDMISLDRERYKDYRPSVFTPINGWGFDYLKNKGQGGVITKSDKPLKVLVFRDSFTTSMVPYISKTFGDVEYIRSHNLNEFQEKIITDKPDIVIHEVVERLIGVLQNNSPKLKEVK